MFKKTIVFLFFNNKNMLKGLPIEQMGIEGEGLVFVVYSDAIATMPGQLNPVDHWT
jgi:hypothetical protein